MGAGGGSGAGQSFVCAPFIRAPDGDVSLAGEVPTEKFTEERICVGRCDN